MIFIISAIVERAKENKFPFHVPSTLTNRPVMELEYHYEQLQKERILRNKLENIEEVCMFIKHVAH